MISGGETVCKIILESGTKFKSWFSVGEMLLHQVHFKVKSGFPQTTSSRPRNWKSIKGHFVGYFIIFQTLNHFKLGVTTLIQTAS
jgi:hypothetical protein